MDDLRKKNITPSFPIKGKKVPSYNFSDMNKISEKKPSSKIDLRNLKK